MDQSPVMLTVNKGTSLPLKNLIFWVCSRSPQFLTILCLPPNESAPSLCWVPPDVNYSFPRHIPMRKGSIINPVVQMGTCGAERWNVTLKMIQVVWTRVWGVDAHFSLERQYPTHYASIRLVLWWYFFLLIIFPSVSLWKKTHSTISSWLNKGAKAFS